MYNYFLSISDQLQHYFIGVGIFSFFCIIITYTVFYTEQYERNKPGLFIRIFWFVLMFISFFIAALIP